MTDNVRIAPVLTTIINLARSYIDVQKHDVTRCAHRWQFIASSLVVEISLTTRWTIFNHATQLQYNLHSHLDAYMPASNKNLLQYNSIWVQMDA